MRLLAANEAGGWLVEGGMCLFSAPVLSAGYCQSVRVFGDGHLGGDFVLGGLWAQI